MNITEKILANIHKNNTYLCVGLDPDPYKIPPQFGSDLSGIYTFLKTIIELSEEYCIAYKPNISFFEALGIDGLQMLVKLKQSVPETHPWIIDAKRGDIGSTAKMQAKFIFEHLHADATTLHPYMGSDSLVPFLEYKDKLSFILGLTSNPSAVELEKKETQDGLPMYLEVTALADRLNQTYQNVGLVVGATQTDEMKRIRAYASSLPFLIPGVGHQGGSYEEAVRYGVNDQGSVIVNVSRQILYPDSNLNFETAVVQTLRQFKRE